MNNERIKAMSVLWKQVDTSKIHRIIRKKVGGKIC